MSSVAAVSGTSPLHHPAYRREVGDGLVLRWSTRDDAARLAAAVAEVFGSVDQPAEAERKFVLEAFHPNYPHGDASDWALVEHAPSGQIVAASALMNQTWMYDGIPFGVGRPEQVVTRPEYRDRGLVRAIFELLHARSAARGHLVQVIDGIPYFYRQLGYEYALDLYGGVRVHWADIDAQTVSDSDESYRLRAATIDDVPQLTRLYAREQTDSLVSVQVDDGYWHWVLTHQDHTAEHGWRPMIIVDAATQASVGYIVLRDGYQWSDAQALGIPALAIEHGVSLRRVMPSVLRALKRLLPTLPKPMTGDPPLRVLFVMGREHPVYQGLDHGLISSARRPWVWYVRVPDLPAFIRHIAPALERRLQQSVVVPHSFDLRISFYRGLLTLRFEHGRLVLVEEQPDRRGLRPGQEDTGAAMPRGQFLQLLFGYRSFEELRDAFPDVLAHDEEVKLFETLFPKRLSRPLLVN